MSWDDLAFLIELKPGDRLRATNELTGRAWSGVVDVVAPEHGQLWLFTELGERKLFDLQEHTFTHSPAETD